MPSQVLRLVVTIELLTGSRPPLWDCRRSHCRWSGACPDRRQPIYLDILEKLSKLLKWDWNSSGERRCRMYHVIAEVLDAAEVSAAVEALTGARFVDGRVTAGWS